MVQALWCHRAEGSHRSTSTEYVWLLQCSFSPLLMFSCLYQVRLACQVRLTCQVRLAGRGIVFPTCSSIHLFIDSFVCYHSRPLWFTYVFMPAPDHTLCFLSIHLSVRPFVCYWSCEYDILKINWTDFYANWNEWSTRQGHEMVNFEGQEIKCQSHTRRKQITKMSSDRYGISRTVRRIFTKPARYILR